MITPIEIDNYFNNGNTIKYSICTLVTNMNEYMTMVSSYEQAGFNTSNSEFIYINNSQVNKYDAYTGLNKCIEKSCGTFIIFTHQDIELKFDNESILSQRINYIELNDPNWAVLSNAGAIHIKQLYKRISHPDHELNQGPFPSKVRSIDENFIVLKKLSGLQFSQNLNGFHLYGTDLCLQAELNGYSCYVIDFHLLHKSTGNMNESFFKAREEFIKSYSGKIRAGYLRTPCTIMYISKNQGLNEVMNSKFAISLAKFVKKLELAFGKISK
jgi:hypothetical protein